MHLFGSECRRLNKEPTKLNENQGGEIWNTTKVREYVGRSISEVSKGKSGLMLLKQTNKQLAFSIFNNINVSFQKRNNENENLNTVRILRVVKPVV